MAATDGGTNETYAKKVIQVITRDLPNFFYLPGTCLEHQSHLGVLGSLKHVDCMLRITDAPGATSAHNGDDREHTP